MRFEYDITSFPDDPDGRNLVLHTEGRLRVLVGDALFLDACDVLLVELAVVLRKWLDALRAGPTDFYYASMDFEEEPILALRYDPGTDSYRLESVWAAAAVPPVPREEAVWAGKKYLSRLRQELRETRAVDLEKTLAVEAVGL